MDFEKIFNSIKTAVLDFIEFLIEIVNHAISLAIDIVQWFKNKYKELRRYAIYLITVIKLKRATQGTPIGDILNGDKVTEVTIPGLYDEEDQKYSEGIAEVIVDNETGNIDTLRILGGTDGISEDLKKAMKNEEVVKLT